MWRTKHCFQEQILSEVTPELAVCLNLSPLALLCSTFFLLYLGLTHSSPAEENPQEKVIVLQDFLLCQASKLLLLSLLLSQPPCPTHPSHDIIWPHATCAFGGNSMQGSISPA